jgi:aspartyl-tRNA(Asn)/glutamyl-tRNA(Gln) amidotransferase subunit C
MVTKEELKKLAKTARLDIKEEECELYLNLMNKDLKDVAEVLKVNTNDYENLINPYDMELRQYPDEVSEGNQVAELMKNAPQSLYNYYVVPKIIDKEE